MSLTWVKKKAKGQLARWETVRNHPQFVINAVDGQPLQDYLYSLAWYDSSLAVQKWKHICSASTLELAQEQAERFQA